MATQNLSRVLQKHVPSIQFRYALAKSGKAPVAPVTSRVQNSPNPATSQQHQQQAQQQAQQPEIQQTLQTSKPGRQKYSLMPGPLYGDTLPNRYKPRLLSDDEIAAIMSGGAESRLR